MEQHSYRNLTSQLVTANFGKNFTSLLSDQAWERVPEARTLDICQKKSVHQKKKATPRDTTSLIGGLFSITKTGESREKRTFSGAYLRTNIENMPFSCNIMQLVRTSHYREIVTHALKKVGFPRIASFQHVARYFSLASMSDRLSNTATVLLTRNSWKQVETKASEPGQDDRS